MPISGQGFGGLGFFRVGSLGFLRPSYLRRGHAEITKFALRVLAHIAHIGLSFARSNFGSSTVVGRSPSQFHFLVPLRKC